MTKPTYEESLTWARKVKKERTDSTDGYIKILMIVIPTVLIILMLWSIISAFSRKNRIADTNTLIPLPVDGQSGQSGLSGLSTQGIQSGPSIQAGLSGQIQIEHTVTPTLIDIETGALITPSALKSGEYIFAN